MLTPVFWGFLGTFTHMAISSSIRNHYWAVNYSIEHTYIPQVWYHCRRHRTAAGGGGGGTIYDYWPENVGFLKIWYEKNVLMHHYAHNDAEKSQYTSQTVIHNYICFYSTLAAFYSSRYGHIYILLHIYIYMLLEQKVVMRCRNVTRCCINA